MRRPALLLLAATVVVLGGCVEEPTQRPTQRPAATPSPTPAHTAQIVLHGEGTLDCAYVGTFPCNATVVIRPAGYNGSWEPAATDSFFSTSWFDEDGIQVVEGDVREAPSPLPPGTYLVAGVMGVPSDEGAQPPATLKPWTILHVGCTAEFDVSPTTERVDISVTYRPDDTCAVIIDVTDSAP